MTNSEAIKSMRNLDDLISITESEHESVKTAISALEHNSTLIEHISNLQNENTDFFNKLVESERENDKLKAEIEQYKSALITWSNSNKGMLKFNQELKDKIEQLKEDYSVLARQYNNVENSSIRYYNEVKQLKSELEQSVKLPCKVGDVVYECDKDVKEIKCYKIKRMQSVTIELDFIGDIFTRSKLVSCGSEHIGNLIFLTREEAE